MSLSFFYGKQQLSILPWLNQVMESNIGAVQGELPPVTCVLHQTVHMSWETPSAISKRQRWFAIYLFRLRDNAQCLHWNGKKWEEISQENKGGNPSTLDLHYGERMPSKRRGDPIFLVGPAVIPNVLNYIIDAQTSFDITGDMTPASLANYTLHCGKVSDTILDTPSVVSVSNSSGSGAGTSEAATINTVTGLAIFNISHKERTSLLTFETTPFKHIESVRITIRLLQRRMQNRGRRRFHRDRDVRHIHLPFQSPPTPPTSTHFYPGTCSHATTTYRMLRPS
ncbi:hypothetical protein ACO22_02011 [Paracoccidioides brasiliensis]|uniref:Uncharacterized protein n=1 Tax=Paracoccidioides brasiliensis TaxID=121759 RepID=A0A1D2JJZ8_PARBR|nr:hypothetical protein ACO22_02011 [Paracoccidioides brasiliensis]